MAKIVLTKQEAKDVLYGDADSEIVVDELTDTSRWSTHHRLIFKRDGKLYETTYSRGATECQDEQPFDYDSEVVCVEVEAYEKTVTDYRAVKD